MNIFKKLFGPKKLPIDQLLELTGIDNFEFWNGVNYYGEIMFTKEDTHPQHGKTYFTEGDYPTFFKLGFGRLYSGYGDWAGGDRCAEPLVEIFVDRDDYKITWININSGFYNGDRPSKGLLKQVNKILKNVRIGTIFKISNESINAIIDYFTRSPDLTDDFRYACCISYGDFESGSLDRFKRIIQSNIEFYKEKHPKYELSIDKDWLKEHPDIAYPEKVVFDTWDEMYARENELADGPLHIPREFLHVEINKKW